MNNIFPIFDFLKTKSAEDQKTILITLIAVTGASTRNPGAHMAVAEDGSSVGSFSGGCVETAVVSEALDAMTAGQPRAVRFGAGSPYLDIRLPCGGGIDLLFNPILDTTFPDEIFQHVKSRQPFVIRLDSVAAPIIWKGVAPGRKSVEQDGTAYHIHHIPPAKIIILGHGPSVASLARLTEAYGISCEVLSPDAAVVNELAGPDISAQLLKTPGPSDFLDIDPWTACIFYFHDHDWEAQLMKQVLDSDAFYIGAMGSHHTHATRKRLLTEIDVSPADIARMSAPIGLIPSTRDPETLALSTLAELVESYHRQFGLRV